MIDPNKTPEDYSAKALVELTKCDKYSTRQKRCEALQDGQDAVAVHVSALHDKQTDASLRANEFTVLLRAQLADSTRTRLQQLFDRATGTCRDSQLMLSELDPLAERFKALREHLANLNEAARPHSGNLAACKAELKQLRAAVTSLKSRLDAANPHSTSRESVNEFITFEHQARASHKLLVKQLHALERIFRMIDAGRQSEMPIELYRAGANAKFLSLHKSWELEPLGDFWPELKDEVRRELENPQPEPEQQDPIDVMQEEYNDKLASFQQMLRSGTEQLPDWQGLLDLPECIATKRQVQHEYDCAFTRSIVGADLSKLLIYTAPDFVEATQAVRELTPSCLASCEKTLARFSLAQQLFVRQRNADCRDFRDKAGNSPSIEECNRYYDVFLMQRDLGHQCELMLARHLKELKAIVEA